MSKIVLVSEKLNTTTWQLAQILREQQHDITIITSKNEYPQNAGQIQILSYFQKWNLFEVIQLIPTLFHLNPQVMHFILEEDRLNTAMAILATYCKTHPHCILSTSLLHVRHSLHRPSMIKKLVEDSDIITCPTNETLGELRGLKIRSHRQGRAILPPVLDFKVEAHHHSENLSPLHWEWLNEKFLIIPFQENNFDPRKPFFQKLQIIAQHHKVVLWGNYTHWPTRERKKFANWLLNKGLEDRWFVTGDLPTQTESILFSHCQAVVLAGLDLIPSALTELFAIGIKNNKPIVMDTSQATVHFTMWKHKVNCWILDQKKINQELTRLLNQSSLELPESLQQKLAQERHIIDNQFNELNRLYNKAIENKNWALN